MTAEAMALTIDQGATFALTLTWKDSTGALINLTGFTARAQVRASYSAAAKLLDLTTENGGITLGGVAGTVALLASAATTATLPPGFGVWDLELVSPGGVVTRLVQGTVTISPEVTR